MTRTTTQPISAKTRMTVTAIVGIGLALAVAFVLKNGALYGASVSDAEIVQTRAVYFYDQPDGRVVVKDADSDQAISVLAVGEHGFVRTTLRGLVRERRLHELDDSEPFIVEARSNGDILLKDCATGRVINLVAFGQTNMQAFAAFLPEMQHAAAVDAPNL